MRSHGMHQGLRLTLPAQRSARFRRSIAALATAGALLPALANAQEAAPAADTSQPVSKAECAEAFEQSQRLRKTFQYVEATAKALRCANPACGAALSEECGKLYGELEAATPSIVLGARSEDGTELRDVTVTIDDGTRRVVLDGTPLLLDPGNHELTFAAEGFEPLRQSAVVRAGERFRPIIGVLQSRDKPAPAAALPTTPAAPEAGKAKGPPLASYVLGGVAVAGFAGFVGFRIAGAKEYESLERECKPTCAAGAADGARRSYVLSYAGLALGGVASIAAVTLYLASPSKPALASATLQIRQLPTGVAAHFTAPF